MATAIAGLKLAGGVAAAAGTAAIATFLANYPRHAVLQQGRFPVGCCLARWEGGPACQIFYPINKASVDGPRAPFFRKELVQQIADMYLQGYVPAQLIMFLAARGPFVQDGAVETEAGKFPVLLFSHGLFGTLDVYKTFCGGMASCGYVVVATEHEDGSALFARDATGAVVPYQGPPKGNKYERDVVVNFRRKYIEKRTDELVAVQQAILKGQATTDNSALVQAILKQANTEEFFLAGHSFGSAASLTAVSKLVGIKACMLLDLWSFPVSREIEEKGIHTCPTMYINSEPFVKGAEIPITQNIISKSSNCLGGFWIEGSAHQSFSDTPCVLPQALGKKILLCGDADRDEVHQTMINVTRSFFDIVKGGKLPQRGEVEKSLMEAEPLLRSFL